MKIYTKTGDKGFTSLIGGTRVPKHHIRIESYGTVDELNSYIGLIGDQDIDAHDKEVLKQIQDRLFTIGSSLAADPERSRMVIPDLNMSDVEMLEAEMDTMNESLPALRHFILPGGSNVISFCHIARCVCRRAERITVQLAEESTVDEKVNIYLNRLSDYLFTLARKIANANKIAENQWIPRV
ncbi:cob(I)yrinic acid a,c-diamide adenosyltransferase [Mucilaginibacter rubeus]|uniref:Corrinoid adenosyltransferase n=1 Tax=Mucilaginibacter rubeus TaxID=2027860 RepID=A0AAE6JFC1_9SPHI|nr:MULTISPECIES: cob(I)yrinic acid a,c-diamide adenosyltransferase [Mucilaginibacter]QEM04573.1 cob(I)yrinic acid a,c-diamide adenosyltransferase [Mucilaginibacter rubeus]QEM17166.1 cob(I)yrinic acid a,c-diamide adenosyltransferase [Mucilaginibacter gossypii]QTE46329.1 cob(I)yrinic acid a,c-diamide adenosyltransferase [Mucilaginibacter rubeus]QTE52926.1 cob(I)yrinic acid a,c-diamide adenosyltransferase [Mucilaginibacter rubeus]QTE58012.1 cob(I)yrinic acid a,c-diamide adenosyltransferase [Mucil